MTTTTQAAPIAQSQSQSEILPFALATLMGLGLIFAAGFAHSAAMHDVAHDQRHAVAFPCH